MRRSSLSSLNTSTAFCSMNCILSTTHLNSKLHYFKSTHSYSALERAIDGLDMTVPGIWTLQWQFREHINYDSVCALHLAVLMWLRFVKLNLNEMNEKTFLKTVAVNTRIIFFVVNKNCYDNAFAWLPKICRMSAASHLTCSQLHLHSLSWLAPNGLVIHI